MLLLTRLQVNQQKLQNDFLVHLSELIAHFMACVFALVLQNVLNGSIPNDFEHELLCSVQNDN